MHARLGLCCATTEHGHAAVGLMWLGQPPCLDGDGQLSIAFMWQWSALHVPLHVARASPLGGDGQLLPHLLHNADGALARAQQPHLVVGHHVQRDVLQHLHKKGGQAW